MNVRRLILTTCLTASIPYSVSGQTAEQRGLDLVREMDVRGRGYRDFEARLAMRIYDADDDVRTREMLVRGLENEDGDRTLIELERPADLAGTTFLTVQGRDGDRAQWIYLPSQRRARRISGSQSSDRFLGSHFTYADLAPPSVEGFDYRWIRDERMGDVSGAVVERRRSEGTTGLARALLWIDTDRYLLHRVDYFDEAGAVRTLVISDYTVIGAFSRPERMEMTETGSGARTVLEWSAIRLGVGLSERDFDPARLGR